MSDWAKALNEALLNRGDKIPAGWKTSAEVLKLWKVGRNSGLAALRKMLASGRVERKRFSVVKDGRLRVVPHYRLR